MGKKKLKNLDKKIEKKGGEILKFFSVNFFKILGSKKGWIFSLKIEVIFTLIFEAIFFDLDF